MAILSRTTTRKTSLLIPLINPSAPLFLYFHCFVPLSPSPSSNKMTKTPCRNHHHQAPSFAALFTFAFLVSLSLSLSIAVFLLLRHHNHPCHITSAVDPSISAAAAAAPNLQISAMTPLPIRGVMLAGDSPEFWRQPESLYRPCLEFGVEYRKRSARVSRERRRFLVVVVSGGLNQQRNQIVDAVVIARILEASLVLPLLQVNQIWGDESEFSELFDVEHFKKTLQADVRIVSSIPSTHLFGRQKIESKIPRDVTPQWIHSRFFNQLNHDGLLVLKGLDSKLTKNLSPDLQKLKCKVAFHALRFIEPIRALGDQLAKRMWIEGPYIALHLRLEKDVWVRTGCLTGLGPEFDDVIAKVRKSHPELLTGTVNMTYAQRRLAGLCPLNAFEMARLLKGLGAPKTARIYIAGGEPFGGNKALKPLVDEFPNLVTKELLARQGELELYANKSSALAAIDYIVSLSSDVFLPSHGGNMARAMQGHRAYVGERKFIKPNKRLMLPFFEDGSISESDFGAIMRELHNNTQGQNELMNQKRDRDVIAYPIPDCMCRTKTNIKFF